MAWQVCPVPLMWLCPRCPMAWFLLCLIGRCQRMGRIAYLSRRGRIWWFRRCYPAIITIKDQLADLTGGCDESKATAQGRGHLVVSLQTFWARQARLLAARVFTLWRRKHCGLDLIAHKAGSEPDCAAGVVHSDRHHDIFILKGNRKHLQAVGPFFQRGAGAYLYTEATGFHAGRVTP